MHANIKKFYYYKGFLTLAFFYSTFVIFLQSKGLSLTQITLIFSAHSATALLMEVPGGAFADTYGKKTSIVLGTLGITLSFLINGIGIQFWHFIIASVIGGVGWSLISGADSAFIHQSLDSAGKKDEYSKVYGRVTGIARLSNALGGFLGSLLYLLSHALPLFATAFSTTIAFFIALTFRNSSDPKEETKTSALQITKNSFHIIRHHPQLMWLFLLTAFLTAFIWSINIMLQPYMLLIGIPVQYFGVIFAAIAIISAASSSFLHKLKKYHSEKYLLILLGIVGGIILLMGLKPILLVFALFPLVDVSSAVVDILVSAKVLHIVNEKQAATVLSFQNFGIRSVNIVSSPLLGWLSDTYGLPVGLMISGGVLLCVLLALMVVKQRQISISS